MSCSAKLGDVLVTGERTSYCETNVCDVGRFDNMRCWANVKMRARTTARSRLPTTTKEQRLSLPRIAERACRPIPSVDASQLLNAIGAMPMPSKNDDDVVGASKLRVFDKIEMGSLFTISRDAIDEITFHLPVFTHVLDS